MTLQERSSLGRLSTDVLQAQILQRLAIAIIEVLNDDSPFGETINRVVAAIQEYTGIEAVGIRLRNGEDFTYFATQGFTANFHESENSLLQRQASGDICRDEDGNPVLECLCGVVLSGRAHPGSRAFTVSGSCFVNQGSNWLDGDELDRDTRTRLRSRCCRESYQSIALVPVRTHREIVGLLQLCDKRPGCFNMGMIEFFEGLSSSIGLALTKKQAEDELKAKSEKLNLALTSVGMGVWRWEIAEDERHYDKQTCGLLGIDPATFTGRATEFFDIVHPDDRLALTDTIQRTLEHSGTYEKEYRVIWKDGSTHHLSSRGTCIRDRKGRPVRIDGVLWDITERRQAECALRRNEAIQRAILTNISDVVAIVDADGVNRFRSSNIERLFGWKPEEVVGGSLALRLHPDERQGLMRELGSLANAPPNGKARGECRYRSSDGSYQWIEYNAVNLRSDPDINGVLLNFHDITERRASQDHLRLLQATINLAPDNIFWVNAAGQVRFANTAACHTLGYEAEALSNLPFCKVIPKFDAAEWQTLWQRVKSGERVVLESSSQCADRTVFPVEIASTFVSFGADEYVCCFVRDITERQLTQAALHETEELYRVLFECSRDALMTLAPPDWRFQDCNAAALALFGIPKAADFRKCTPQTLSPETQADGRSSADRVAEMIEIAMRNGMHSFEWTHRRINGEEFPATVLLTRVELNGVQMLQATIRDESERRLMMARMAQADRLASMGMLSAGLAHEINNPLAYVRYNIESLAEDVPRLIRVMRQAYDEVRVSLGEARHAELVGENADLLNDAALKDIVERMDESLEGIQRIVSITRTLSTYSRVEQSNRTKVDVTTAIESAINMAHSEVAYRARIVKQIEGVPCVWASEGKLAQVFLNLIVNAAQAIDEGNVARNTITIRARLEAGSVFVEITDTGKGILEENLERIFEPFFTTKQLGDGAGLGLSISKSILAEFGGTLAVKSKVSAGSTFKVTLPSFVEPASTTVQRKAPAAPVLDSDARARILLIDDEANIARSLMRLLGGSYSVTAVSCGKDAQELISTDAEFDLILCDLMMSRMSGIEFHSWLVTHNRRLASQLIFITGGAFTPRAREYLAKVDNLTIQKPFEAATLRSQVAAAIHASKQRP